MWDSCFERVEMTGKGFKGSGCILAHCMGLGKTLQIVTLVHTLLTHGAKTKCKRVLILMPKNVLLNWKHEFTHWTKKCKKKIKVFDVTLKQSDRLKTLQEWFQTGGVFLMSYSLFSRLVLLDKVKNQKTIGPECENPYHKYLLSPGADFLVFDEGHILKNDATNLSKSVFQVETLRRVVLTGTPLQNNLVEYHCMISFVKPKLLGTLGEFKNRFVNPIYNGQHKDSTDADVRYMKKRAHILHNQLTDCVQRKDSDIMRNLIPPKNEYVLSIRLSDKQIELYKTYLNKVRGNGDTPFKNVKGQILPDFHALSKIIAHPWIAKQNELKKLRITKSNLDKKNIYDYDLDNDAGDEDDDEMLEAKKNKAKM